MTVVWTTGSAVGRPAVPIGVLTGAVMDTGGAIVTSTAGSGGGADVPQLGVVTVTDVVGAGAVQLGVVTVTDCGSGVLQLGVVVAGVSATGVVVVVVVTEVSKLS